MKWTRVAVQLAVVAALGAGGFYGWRTWQTSQTKTLEERYQFEEVVRGPITQTVTANGTLNPVALVNVGTQVSGTVQHMHADFNSKVSAGQMLLELDPTLFRAAVEQSSGNVANATASLELARVTEARIRDLLRQDYVPQQDLDQAIQARKAAEAQLRTARGQLARDQANLAFSVIRSPVSGTVVSRSVDVGQTVAASFQTPTLFQIAQDLARMQIDTNVAEADIGRVRTDQAVKFTVDAFPGRHFEGRVRQIRLSPIIQQNVVTYNVVVGVDNQDLVLMPGMTAYIAVQVDRREDTLLVPAAALRFRPKDAAPGGKPAGTTSKPAPAKPDDKGAGGGSRGPGARVFVARGEELVPVSVKTGLADNRTVEITSGDLKVGDRVAVQSRLTEGAAAGSGRPPSMRAF
jgi:HlyD family secretion protein